MCVRRTNRSRVSPSHTQHNTQHPQKQTPTKTKFLYFFSSYWNQFGPNCTTWLVAAEVYPTDVRATCQGFSAAMGKVGAILADIIFGYVDTRTTFYLSAAFGLFGAVLTAIFLPDTTGLSLDELDRMAKYMLAGEFDSYHGQAVNVKHLSLYERWRGYGKSVEDGAGGWWRPHAIAQHAWHDLGSLQVE